jgi:hypothetical protein
MNIELYPTTVGAPSLALLMIISLLTLCTNLGFANDTLAKMPNIVGISTNDQGHADIRLNDQHAKEFPTPISIN